MRLYSDICGWLAIDDLTSASTLTRRLLHHSLGKLDNSTRLDCADRLCEIVARVLPVSDLASRLGDWRPRGKIQTGLCG